MNYRYQEVEGLSPLAYVWEYKVEQPMQDTVLPNGFMLLALSLQGRHFIKTDSYSLTVEPGDALIAGMHLEPFQVITEGYKILGLQLHPLLFRAVTGLPADEFTGKHIRADAVIPSTRALVNRCQQASSFATRAEILKAWIRQELEESHELQLALRLEQEVDRQLHRDPTLHSAIEDMSGYSRAQTFRILKEWFGTAPGTYWRKKKFLKGLRVLHETQGILPSWFRAGYYDHPHFARSFRQFTGLTPSSYVEQMSHHRGHIYDETMVQGGLP